MSDKDLFMKRFEEKLREQLDDKDLNSLSGSSSLDSDNSIDYEMFRTESLPSSINFYEKFCNFSESIISVAPDEKSKKTISDALFSAHLNCTPNGVMSSALFYPLLILLIGLGVFLVAPTFGVGIIIVAMASYFILLRIPTLLAKRMRAKANDQIIIAIFYIVAFMRFNSNFELAINFAANYLNAPLSLDFKRILWDLENSKYPNIKTAMDKYLEGWRDENLEFLESIYLIESSLYESDSFRRITLLEKALDIILQGNYEKMLHFAQELRGKVTSFNMLGVVLPILGLIILPLAASMGNPKGVWQIVVILYDVIIPVLVGYYGFLIIFNRPSSVNSIKPPKNLKGLVQMQKAKVKIGKDKYIYVSPKIPALIIFCVFMLIGLSPILLHMTNMDLILNDKLSFMISDSSSPFSYFQEYKSITPKSGPEYIYGPYGIFPGILSLFFPLAFAFSIGYYMRYKYQNLIHMRDKTRKLEEQFPSATFQLGNRINEGISAELAFGAVAETMKGTEAGLFFSKIDSNIKFEGMSVEKAIFDEDKGALVEYPSDLIISSMKILIHAIDRGPDITAKTLVDLSRYLSEIHMSAERIRDLLAESISSMRSQLVFLAPVISGIVIAIVSLVTMIMGNLSKATASLALESQAGGAAGLGNLLGEGIPTYLFQASVGFYVFSLIIILVYMVINLENGEDSILLKYQMGEKLISGMTKYSIVVALGIIGFGYIGWQVLGSIV